MNIGIEATSAAETHKAGVGFYTYHLLRAIARLRREEHTYTCYLRRPWPDDAFSNAGALPAQMVGKVLRFPSLWAQIRLPIELRWHPQEVYFFPAPVLPLLYQPAQSVVTIHDVAFLFFPECFAPRLRRWLHIATKQGVARARKIIAVSAATKRDLVAYYAVPAENIVVVHHGVSELYQPLAATPAGQAAIAAVKAKYHLTNPYLLCIGTLQKRKNLPRLLQAFDALKQQAQIPHQLVLAGPQYADLPAQDIFATAERLLLQKEVICTGYVPEEDKIALLSGAEVFVFPSLYEGFGMSLLEAMACGVPIACANTSAFPEVVGASAAMFDPSDLADMAATLARVLRDANLRHRLRQQGLQRVKAFSWERCAQQTLAVLESVGKQK